MLTNAPTEAPTRNGGRPRVIIIGAGISGLATGVYAQMNGMESQIFESYVVPGGCCTAWTRKGYVFDYCIDWLLGSVPGNEANQVWRELGALDGKEVKNFEMFNRVVGEDGRSVTFYNDPDRLEAHLIGLSPQDTALIKVFCNDLRRFVKHDFYPFLKPRVLLSLRERISRLISILPMFRLFWRNATTQMNAFCNRFEDPLLRRAFCNIFFQDHECFPLLPYLFNMACAFKNNAGFPQGGSLGLSKSIAERYRSLGGTIQYRSRVTRILVEDDRAVGVQLKNGMRYYADFVVSACDGLTTIYGMLEAKYVNETIETLYRDMLHRPDILYPGVVSAFVGVEGDFDPQGPHSTTYLLSREGSSKLPGVQQNSFVVQLRSHYSSEFAPSGKSVIHCTYFSDFKYWNQLRISDKPKYRAEKRRVDEFVRVYLERLYPGIRERIELIEISTPATTKRYTGNFNGSILAWKSFTDAEDLTVKLINRNKMQLQGLSRFYMAGQWIGMGGLVRAASSGRWVVQFICKELGREFHAWVSPNDDASGKARASELIEISHEPVFEWPLLTLGAGH